MDKEDKELLIRDLCARVPYKIKVCLYEKETCILTGIDGNEVYLDVDSDSFRIESIKPYLRPMLSMTEEELAEYEKANDLDTLDSSETLRENMKAERRVRISKWYHGTDWLNKHHFDYRGLIEKRLALVAPDGMYNN